MMLSSSMLLGEEESSSICIYSSPTCFQWIFSFSSTTLFSTSFIRFSSFCICSVLPYPVVFSFLLHRMLTSFHWTFYKTFVTISLIFSSPFRPSMSVSVLNLPPVQVVTCFAVDCHCRQWYPWLYWIEKMMWTNSLYVIKLSLNIFGLACRCFIPAHFDVQGSIYTKPGLQAEKKNQVHHKIQKEYRDDGLSVYTVSSLKTVGHHYILFVSMVCSFFFSPAVRDFYMSGLRVVWWISPHICFVCRD